MDSLASLTAQAAPVAAAVFDLLLPAVVGAALIGLAAGLVQGFLGD